jgi:hypothetical protein
VLGVIGLIFVLIAERGKLFRAVNPPASQVIHID